MKENSLIKRILAFTLLILGCFIFLVPLAFSFVNEFTPFLRYYSTSILIKLISFWIAGVLMLISYSSKKATIAILIISAISILPSFFPAVPNYLLTSKLGLTNTYFFLLAPCMPSVAVFISSTLFLATKNKYLSYFLSLIISVLALCVMDININSAMFGLIILLTAIPFSIVHYKRTIFIL